MTKSELLEKIIRSKQLPPDVTKKCAGQILDIAFEELSAYFVRSKVTRTNTPRFTFPGFGTFTKKKRRARKGVNPRTLEPMQIEACTTLDFRPGVELRRGMNPARDLVPAHADEHERAMRSKRGKPLVLAQSDPDERPSRRRLTPRDEGGHVENGYTRARTHVDNVDDELDRLLPAPSLARSKPGKTTPRSQSA